jgi:ribosome recycling factor
MDDNFSKTLLADLATRMESAASVFKHHLNGLRTGRASPELLDAVRAHAYGSAMPLNQLATISIPEPRVLRLDVWDITVVGAVEKAIRDSNLGLNPQTEGVVIRLRMPDMTEERRKELVKAVSKYAEEARVAVRHVRRDGLDALKKAEKDKKMSEDTRLLGENEVQKLTDSHVKKIDEVCAEKEIELMKV